MIDSNRFKKIRSLQDIKLEKAKLRYEMLLAENRLNEDLNAIQGIFATSSLLSSLREVVSYGSKVFSGVQRVMGWVFRGKQRVHENESSD